MRYSTEVVGNPPTPVLVPNPGRRKPKPGHWRTSGQGRVTQAPRSGGRNYLPANVQGQAVQVVGGHTPAHVRAKVRQAVALGYIPRSAAPTWAR